MPLLGVIRKVMFLQTSVHPAGLALFPVKRGGKRSVAFVEQEE